MTAADDIDAPKVVVINQAMARRWWPDEDPIGKHLKIKSARNPQTEWSTVIGIVGDMHGYGLDKPTRAEMYFPHAQLRRAPGMTLIIRTAGDPRAMANAARGAIAEIDPNQPVFRVMTMDDYVASSLARRRFAMVLMLLFGGVALLLAAVGIYGVMSYTVAQRTHEIGIRVALGARPADVLGMVVRQGMTLVALGLGLGLAGALALTRLVASLLFGVSSTDVLTYGAIAGVLALVAFVATVIPARRATRVDPMLALRAD
jgi:putative ABC transport system permease protein